MTNHLSLPARRAIFSFLLLSLAIFAVAMFERINLLEPGAVKRIIGLLVGIVLMVTGNYLPKTRPLKALQCSSARAASAERFAGWALFLVGAVDVSAFLFIPLGRAMLISSCVGAGVVLAVGLRWMLLFRRSRQADGESLETESVPRAQGEREMLSLVVVVMWILATSFMKHVWADSSSTRMMSAWIILTAGIIYASVLPVLHPSHDRTRNCSVPEEQR